MFSVLGVFSKAYAIVSPSGVQRCTRPFKFGCQHLETHTNIRGRAVGVC